MNPFSKILSCFILSLLLACNTNKPSDAGAKIRVLFDTDANNELDDQHALAYLLFNGDTFDLAGVTVNATRSGGRIEKQYAEADRVMRLCGFEGPLPIFKGADSSFDSIQANVGTSNFDGEEAVNFIIAEAKKTADRKLVVIAVGKLTNIALALKKDPAIAGNFRLVWLGSNFPDPGEYNLDNDTASVNYVAKSGVEFEIVTVRYGKPSGSDFVKITREQVDKRLRGKGPRISTLVQGRHGGSFNNFGDYSVSLFDHIDLHGDPPSRALFDMVAVAIVKNPAWGQRTAVEAYQLIDNQWVKRPENQRQIIIWENFDKNKILDDFYQSVNSPRLVQLKK